MVRQMNFCFPPFFVRLKKLMILQNYRFVFPFYAYCFSYVYGCVCLLHRYSGWSMHNQLFFQKRFFRMDGSLLHLYSVREKPIRYLWVVYLLYNVFIYSIVKKVIHKKFRTEKRASRSCPFVNYIDFLSLISAIFASFKREAPRTLEKDRYPFIRSIFVTFLDPHFGHTSMSSCSYPQSSQ